MRDTLARHGISDIVTDSAGILQLPPHPIDPLMLELMRTDRLDGEDFLSTPLTPAISQDADLILCFEKQQIAAVVSQNPRAARKTFLFQDFVNVCDYLNQDDQIHNSSVTPSSRLHDVMDQVPLIRPFLPIAQETQDPHGKTPQVFADVHAEILDGIDRIVNMITEFI